MTISKTDISQAGVFLYTTRPPQMATRLMLVLNLPEQGEVVVEGHVVQRIEGFGMGVKFSRFFGDGKQRLTRFKQDAQDSRMHLRLAS